MGLVSFATTTPAAFLDHVCPDKVYQFVLEFGNQKEYVSF